MSKTLVFITLVSVGVCGAQLSAKTRAPAQGDAAFLAMAAEADMTMANIGQIAETRAASNKVKDFASKLVRDHTHDYQQLTALAAKIGDTVPKGIDKQNERTIAELNRHQGKTFDRAFLNRQSLEHEKLISAFKQEAEHGSNPNIKAYANEALATIESHLHDAQDLMKQRG
jgi:putative membrane protein